MTQVSVDPFEGKIVGRDPLSKTLVEALVEAHPDWSDEQISERINRQVCPDDTGVMTPEIVAYWRPEVAA